MEGAYELVVSLSLLAELGSVFQYPRIAGRVRPSEAGELLDLLRRQAQLVDDPAGPPVLRSPDPGEDYLIPLAEAARAVIVSGDAHLQSMADLIPVFTPAAFLAFLAAGDR